MIFHSIRWRLQIWYGIILVALLAGFGFTAYRLERNRVFRQVDEELHFTLDALAGFLRGPARGPGPNGGPFDGRRPDRPRFRPGQPPPDRPWTQPPDGAPVDPAEPGEPSRNLREIRLPPRLAELFDESDTNGFYYVIFNVEGNQLAELRRSTNAPADVALVPPPSYRANQPRMNNPPPLGPPLPPAPPVLRSRADFREASVNLRRNEIVLAGRSIAPELGELHRVAWVLAGVGGVILLMGLAGGWWLAGRAIRPIEEISATALKISAGDLARRISVADTESELGRLASVLNSTFARLETSFAQQQQFTSDAAHDLRTPVSVMLTQTQTALSRERSALEYRETVEACQRAAQRMRRLIESLLELARLDAGQETLKRAPLDLARIAADGMELIRPLAEARRITLHGNLAPAKAEGDAERLAQVVTNLLSNAVHYNKDGGEIRVSSTQEGAFVLLTVEDTGVGIAPEHLPRVFERFYRADLSRAGSEGRAGLGLAISRAIVEAHGGSIEVSSEAGVGTKFTVRLPS